jgi:decaprenylphospho-beta-D-ribofuranose 2-oxidase
MPRRTVTNWGNFPRVEADVTETSRLSEIAELIGHSDNLTIRGNGRSYGDASLGENIFSTLRLNKFLDLDLQNGEMECESGVLFSEILDVIVPKGFFLPVTPGTKFITLGGAIGADVHGKNHHKEGSFASHIVRFDLMNETGDIVRCSPTENAELFWKTCGGMGLTGIILRARFKLKRIETSFIDQVSIKSSNIDAAMRAFEENTSPTYSVAWLDCAARGDNLGRSILQLGEHSPKSDLPAKFAADPLALPSTDGPAIPIFMPSFALNPLTVKSFNTAYYNRQQVAKKNSVIHFDPFFYPLDGIRDWNKLYGKNGFVQYQFVLPLEKSYDGIVEILEKISASGEGSPLAVLKLFGKPDPNAVMSFPMEGYTLALDLKVSDRVFRLLDELDELVMKHNGRIYLAKDARMKAATFQKTYKNFVSPGYFTSNQSKRLQD